MLWCWAVAQTVESYTLSDRHFTLSATSVGSGPEALKSAQLVTIGSYTPKIADARLISATNRLFWNVVPASRDASGDTLHRQIRRRQPQEDEMDRISRGE